ncbi:MAG TPA: FAD-linked oxidase C-terminal domain-containing protein [Terriglobales bacterium]|jgi:glycolate oxidase|nr:FAD-linked oxidase C-terminal domain-containing protein [Terriglobales bacterium]
MNFSSVVRQLKKIVGRDAVLERAEDLMLYEYDAGILTGSPRAVVFVQTTEQVSRVMRLATESGFPIVPRGAGTGLSGGAIAREGAIVLAFARMNRILEIDAENQRAVVQPGVVNLDLSAAAKPYGLYFAPDPSSQKACTIGGNVAENSGGPHTLAYGVTVNHVTGVEVVLPDGRIVNFGGKTSDLCGYDLTGFFVGSEGTLAIATKIVVRLMRIPEAVATLLAIYNTIEDAANTVVALTQEGITPAALEMMDGWVLRMVEAATHAGYPLDAGAVLLIEVEGLREAVEEQAEAVRQVCRKQKAREVRRARDERERQLLWAGRKNAAGAVGRVSPKYYTQDGVIPRTRIPDALRYIESLAKKYSLTIGNILHAGDGNLHPIICFDPRDPDHKRRAIQASDDIIVYCISVGGSITGEHGVGMEKNELMGQMFSEDDLAIMQRLHDCMNPRSILNPQKLFPTSHGCREAAASPALTEKIVGHSETAGT